MPYLYKSKKKQEEKKNENNRKNIIIYSGKKGIKSIRNDISQNFTIAK